MPSNDHKEEIPLSHRTATSAALRARPASRVRATAAAVSRPALALGNAQAFELDTGNADVTVRWDNTVRLNYGERVEGRDSKIGNSVLADEGDYSFNKGDTVANRLDLLSELDVVYKKRYGFRLSGAAWYDDAYGNTSTGNPNPPWSASRATSATQYTPLVKRLYHGRWRTPRRLRVRDPDIGPVPVTFKAGRHTLYWGESLMLAGNMHGVAYAQNPLDLQKGYATPGTEAKELFRPLPASRPGAAHARFPGGPVPVRWEPALYPEGGTFLGPVDFAFNGPQRQFLSPALGFAANGGGGSSPSRTANSACRPAGVPRNWTAPSASTTAASPTNCRRRC